MSFLPLGLYCTRNLRRERLVASQHPVGHDLGLELLELWLGHVAPVS